MKYKVIDKRTQKEVTAEAIQRSIIASGHNPQFVLLPNGALRLRTHDEAGYHHFELDAHCDAVAK